MNQLSFEIITNALEPKAVVQELVRRRQGLPYKRDVLRGPDGRILKYIERSWEEIVEDFWSQVKRGHPDDCWEWQGAKSHKNEPGQNYGTTRIYGKDTRTHRFAYTVEHGSIPPGLWVLHTCDNPPCCNPRHLFAGTRRENIDDCVKKGRHPAKLTKEDVIYIRGTYVKGVYGIDRLAAEFGVDRSTIYLVVIRHNWAHV